VLGRLSSAWIFGALSASMAAGYGVLFTIVADYRDSYGISETAIGWLIGLGFITGFAAQVVIAPIGDRGHARTLIRVGVLLNIAGLLMMGFGTTLPVLLAGRVVSGLGIGTSLPAVRRIVILADPDNVGENLGRLLSADVFGFALGPAISAVLVGPMGLAAPFVVVSGLSLALLFWSESVRVDETIDESGQRFAVDLLRSPIVAGAVVLGGAVFLMIGAFDALWDLVHDDLGSPDWLANLGITLFALPLVILGPTSGRLSQRLGPFRVGGVGLLVSAVFIFSYGQLPSGEWIFAIGMFQALNNGLTIAASGVAVAMAVPEERQSGAQGLIGAAQALSGGVAAVVIGTVYESSGRAAAYTTAAVGMVVCTVFGLWLARDFWMRGAHRNNRASQHATARPGRVPTRRPRLRRS